MALAGAGSADQHAVALVLEEVAGGEVADQGLVDRRALEHEVVDAPKGLWGERHLGDGHLVFDRARLLLRDPMDLVAASRSPTTRSLIGVPPPISMLALHGGRQAERGTTVAFSVIGGLHAVELEAGHGGENFGSFHQTALLRRS
jgi:hypothetical protein